MRGSGLLKDSLRFVVLKSTKRNVRPILTLRPAHAVRYIENTGLGGAKHVKGARRIGLGCVYVGRRMDLRLGPLKNCHNKEFCDEYFGREVVDDLSATCGRIF